MKYLIEYKLFESSEDIELKFIKQPKKKDAKTDVYNVNKNGKIIGQIKWSSRMMGYAFQPTNDCNDKIKEFIKDLMNTRRNK
jgi:hypothetical protein